MYNALAMPVSKSTKEANVSFRTSNEFKALLAVVAADFGGSQTAAIEFAIRDYARRHGKSVPKTITPSSPAAGAITYDPSATPGDVIHERGADKA